VGLVVCSTKVNQILIPCSVLINLSDSKGKCIIAELTTSAGFRGRSSSLHKNIGVFRFLYHILAGIFVNAFEI
jgi:hypothetical protein